jgi:hypothetical protein
MHAFRFQATIGPDRTIQVPAEVALSPGQAEIIILQDTLPTKDNGQVPSQAVGPQEHIFDRLARLANELGIDTTELPTDLSLNHDHYLYGVPKRSDQHD